MHILISLLICILFFMTSQAQCEEAIPVYIDLEEGHSADFITKDGVDHTVTLISQSLDEIVVELDGIQSTFNLNENDCGSPETTLFREISGVLVLPEVISDIQQSTDCIEITQYRRWHKLKVGWETGDQAADDDIEDPGFARLALMDPTDTLPQGIFPIEMSNACESLTNTNHYNYYLSHEDYGFHAGVDFSLPIGHNITASRSGVVTEIKRMCAAGTPCDQIVPGIDYCRNFECPYPIGHWDYCRVCGPCGAGQGDCDLDSECQSGMICAQAIGSADVCCPHPVGYWDYCRDCGPCDLGQGDCDNDSECRGDLVCGQIAGASDSCEYESPP